MTYCAREQSEVLWGLSIDNDGKRSAEPSGVSEDTVQSSTEGSERDIDICTDRRSIEDEMWSSNVDDWRRRGRGSEHGVCSSKSLTE